MHVPCTTMSINQRQNKEGKSTWETCNWGWGTPHHRQSRLYHHAATVWLTIRLPPPGLLHLQQQRPRHCPHRGGGPQPPPSRWGQHPPPQTSMCQGVPTPRA